MLLALALKLESPFGSAFILFSFQGGGGGGGLDENFVNLVICLTWNI